MKQKTLATATLKRQHKSTGMTLHSVFSNRAGSIVTPVATTNLVTFYRWQELQNGTAALTWTRLHLLGLTLTFDC